jgi:hypothetical protein
MTARNGKTFQASSQRQHALSRWDYEGGAGPDGPQHGSTTDDDHDVDPPITSTELAQLRVRVIALESLVITLLAGTSERQLGLAREMAAYISPRPGSTLHPMTLRAAAQMVNLVERAEHFQAAIPIVAP